MIRRSRSALAVLAAGATAAALGAVATPALAADEPTGPIASYSFDGGSLADEVGDADLTAAGTAAVATDGEHGEALRLDGSSGGYV